MSYSYRSRKKLLKRIRQQAQRGRPNLSNKELYDLVGLRYNDIMGIKK